MCLIVFSYKQHPEYDLIFAANRDEFYGRPTREAQFWESDPNIMAGKDLKAGGTWLGITREGAFSAITNYRDPEIQKEDPPSRGNLVLDYLKKDGDPISYLEDVKRKGDRYMGFNLLAGNLNRLAYYSNQQEQIEKLEPGIYGLSNHLLDTPWPKAERAKNNFREIIDTTEIHKEALFDMLLDDTKAPDDQLPNTGIPKSIEKHVSSIFIEGEEYGTRCSTVLLIDKEGEVLFAEKRFRKGTKEIDNENTYRFSIE